MTPTRDIDEQTNAAIRGMTERMSVEAGDGQEGVAALIAAAPDMLEALEIAIWIIERKIHGPVAGYSNIVDTIRKARGEMQCASASFTGTKNTALRTSY